MRHRRGLILPPVSGGEGSGGGRTDLPHFALSFDDDFATQVSEGAMFGVNGDHAQGLGAYKNWGGQTYLTTYGNKKGTGDYYGINNMSVVSGITGANGNCLQMRLYIDSSGKKVGCNPYPNLSGTYGSSSASSAQTYGRSEVRWMTTSTAGWKEAWMFWPQSWQWDFEIDWVESALNGYIGANNHHPSSSHNASDSDGYSTHSTSTSWHTSVLEWTPSSVQFFLDGTLFGSSGQVPKAPGFCMLQTENNLPGDPQPSSTGYVWIDYYSQWLWIG